MNVRTQAFLALLLAFAVSGCGKSTSDAPAAPAEVAAPVAVSVAPVDPAEAATVKGRVTYAGEPTPPKEVSIKGNPECAIMHKGGTVQSEQLIVKDGNLKNAFVYVKSGLEGRTFPAPTQPLVIENVECVYVPHVAGVQVGQPVTLLNSDDTLHNMHSYSKENKSWNLGFPIKGMKQTKTFSAPEVMITLKCDVHPWMIAYVGVLPHPFFAVTGDDGSFELKGLPPGDYEVEVIHENLGARSEKITVGPREVKELSFAYEANPVTP